MKRIGSVGIFAGLLLFIVTAEAQTFQVKQVKGRRAIIEVQDGSLQAGQTVSVSGGGSSSGGGDRSNFIGLSGYLTSNSNSGTQMTTLYGDLLYGWNKVQYEYGVMLRLGTVSGGPINQTTAGVGAKFDYNLTPHKNDAAHVYGVGAELVYTSVSTNINATTMYLFPAFSGKWFVLGTTTAIRLDAGFESSQTSANGVNTSNQGLKAAFSLYNYF